MNQSDGTTTTRQRRAFVLMPFERALDWVYDDLIKPPFEDADYLVTRADDIVSQQNILRDVVAGICEADVVVADLTNTNPNVYYELGLAHALEKQVVLLSQDVNKVPFDLRSYRILEYGSRFDAFDEAKKRLETLAKAVAEGRVRFGSPVSDFRPTGRDRLGRDRRDDLGDDDEDGRPGAIDLVIAVQDGVAENNKILQEITKEIEALGEHASETTPKIATLRDAKNMHGLRALFRRSSVFFDEKATRIHELNGRYRAIWTGVSDALEMLFSATTSSQDREGALEQIRGMCAAAGTARAATTTLASNIRDWPNIEQMLNKSRRRVVRALEELASVTGDVESFEGRLRSVMGPED